MGKKHVIVKCRDARERADEKAKSVIKEDMGDQKNRRPERRKKLGCRTLETSEPCCACGEDKTSWDAIGTPD